MRNDKLVNILQQRSSGILLPVFSLPGSWGIGDLGDAARAFIDFLGRAGQSAWQILPLGPTSPVFGDSPYMSFSTFAGNPLFISPEMLIRQGLLQDGDLEAEAFSEYAVDYPRVTAAKTRLLRAAWAVFRVRLDAAATLAVFCADHPWAAVHGLFLALKDRFNGAPWYQWPEPLRHRQETALAEARTQLADEIDYFVFEQYLFFDQWHRLRAYARDSGIALIGDLPIYVALDSVDVWNNQEIFQLDPASGEPTRVAGVPPDYFSANGQRWGNPLYRWNTRSARIRDRLWDWWAERLRLNFELVDVLRIDHFRGFEAYWAVPAAEETAINGTWQPGPGQPFFAEMERRLGGMAIIAEDLGVITPEVERLRLNLGYPGMKILLFAFDGSPDNSYLPFNCEPDSVVYTGTHDNDTAVGWYLSPQVDPAFKRRAKRFANRDDDDPSTFHRDLVHLALGSPANLAVLPLQDVLGFGNDCRLNTPGTPTGNWQWRCAARFLTDETAAWLRDLSTLFGRIPPTPQPKPVSHDDPAH